MVQSNTAGRIAPVAHARLASLEEIESESFRTFMANVNGVARNIGCRVHTNSSKIWEYPWLYLNGIHALPLDTTCIIDIGSELSPLPWYLASRGAAVTLVETTDAYVPAWERIRNELGIRMAWHVVDDERIPESDSVADVVLSASVLEHQHDKRRAVSEAVRVLKIGGRFCVSFDICQPELGMSFPRWNGEALTMEQFEATVWLNSSFCTRARPAWNVEDLAPFLTWHRATAAHRNYVAGGAVLVKGRSAGMDDRVAKASRAGERGVS